MKKNDMKIEDIVVIVLLTLICLMFMVYILKQTDILNTETNIGNDTNITEDQVNIDIDMNDYHNDEAYKEFRDIIRNIVTNK